MTLNKKSQKLILAAIDVAVENNCLNEFVLEIIEELAERDNPQSPDKGLKDLISWVLACGKIRKDIEEKLNAKTK